MNLSGQVVLGDRMVSPRAVGIAQVTGCRSGETGRVPRAWLATATKAIANLQKQSIIARKVDIDVRELSTWVSGPRTTAGWRCAGDVCEREDRQANAAATASAAATLVTSGIGWHL